MESVKKRLGTETKDKKGGKESVEVGVTRGVPEQDVSYEGEVSEWREF